MNVDLVSRDNVFQLPIPACVVIAHCPLETDIVLVSSDGCRFGMHSKNLGEFSGGFPLHITPADGEEVQMPDLDSKALTLFLQYVHHHRQPDLSNVPFKTLRELAEAVEKYDVYSATEICKAHMVLSVSDHCVEVFQYAAKHDYRKLMDDAALIAVQNKSWNREISMRLYEYHPDIQVAWPRFNEHWRDSFNICYNEPHPVLHPGGKEDCGKWRKFRNVVVAQVKREIAVFSSFDGIVEGAKHYLKDCRHCCIRADRWIGQVQGRVWDMPKFTSFLKGPGVSRWEFGDFSYDVGNTW